MNDSLSLGRIAGIRVGLNWSVLALLALLVWTLSAAVFPSTNPDLGRNAHFAMAVIAAVLFFGSILAHEMGHALQARRDGMTIEGITLWLFGGVARFAGNFPSAGAEFRIAVAGPLVSLGLAGGLLGLAQIPGLPEAVDGVATWLGFINGILLVFNLLPALPLDGGRMLRAALWAWKGDLVRATTMASMLGRVLAYGLIGLGAFMFLFRGAFDGAWLVAIGWFVLQALGQEERAVRTQAELGDLRVADLVVDDPVSADPEWTLEELHRRVVYGPRYTVYPVVADGRAVGLLPSDCFAVVPREEWAGRRVADSMLPQKDVTIIDIADDIATAIGRLRAGGIGRALVLDGDRWVGLLSITDVARAVRLRRMEAGLAGE